MIQNGGFFKWKTIIYEYTERYVQSNTATSKVLKYYTEYKDKKCSKKHLWCRYGQRFNKYDFKKHLALNLLAQVV